MDEIGAFWFAIGVGVGICFGAWGKAGVQRFTSRAGVVPYSLTRHLTEVDRVSVGWFACSSRGERILFWVACVLGVLGPVLAAVMVYGFGVK